MKSLVFEIRRYLAVSLIRMAFNVLPNSRFKEQLALFLLETFDDFELK